MQRFSKKAFQGLDAAGKAALAVELGAALAERLRGRNFHEQVGQLVEELRSLGHDLWSFDESDDFEVWCPNYHAASGPGIVITFTVEDVRVEWSGSDEQSSTS